MSKLWHSFVLALICVSLAAPAAHAVSEDQYALEYNYLVKPFYDLAGTPVTFAGKDGVMISGRSFEVPGEKGAIVLVPGRAEAKIKFAEVIFDLATQGYSVYVIDHRGQGESGRMTANPQIGYVRNYADYVADLKTFVDTVVNARAHAKHYLLSNSMGGLISALYLRQYPKDFDAAVFSSPMFEINTGKYPAGVAQALADTFVLFGKGMEYSLDQHDHALNPPFETNTQTLSRARFEMSEQLIAADPALAVGGVSNRWIQQSLRVSHRTARHPGEIALPVLVFEAGQDKIVRLGGEDEFCARVKSCLKTVFPESYHEVLMERDFIRDAAMGQLVDFFAAH